MDWCDLKFCIPNSFASFFIQWKCLSYGKLQSKFWCTLFFAISWSIWLTRNERIFNNKEIPISSLYALILFRVAIWRKASDPNFPFSGNDLLISSSSVRSWTNNGSSKSLVSWNAPPPNDLKWNVDGSSREEAEDEDEEESCKERVVRRCRLEEGELLVTEKVQLGVLKDHLHGGSEAETIIGL
ncbi:uncharacterized protein LOC110647590 [Hevea brasiliensis]|uniref:uncharacterized protein LOC110647590 n=1 Tax=Hevea brasiliensis TaxID=3981 RepID=UPI0025E732A3|nr:uncharacterized protein LOC110647590 [Hevea brasiliensis]